MLLVPTPKLPMWLFTIDRSTSPPPFITVVGSEDELFAPFESPVVETVAVLITLGTAAAPTLTVNVIVVGALTASGPLFVHVTACWAAPQVQPCPVPDTNPSPVGRVSLTVIAPVVGVLPTLVTTIE